MIIRFACPHGHRLTAAGSSAGLRGQCPLCLATVCVPVAQPKPSGKVKKVWNAGPVLRDLESFAEEALSDIGVDEDDPVPESAFVPLDEAPSSVAVGRASPGIGAGEGSLESAASRSAPPRAVRGAASTSEVPARAAPPEPESSSRLAPLKWDAIPTVPAPMVPVPTVPAPPFPVPTVPAPAQAVPSPAMPVPAASAPSVPPPSAVRTAPAISAPVPPPALDSGSSSRLAPLKWDDPPAAPIAPSPVPGTSPFPPSPFVAPGASVPNPLAPSPFAAPPVPSVPTVPDPLAPSPFAAPPMPTPLGGALPTGGVPDPPAPSPFAQPAGTAAPGEAPSFFPVDGLAPKPVETPILIETMPEKKSLRELAGPARLRKTALTALAMLVFAVVSGLPTQQFLPDLTGMPPWAKVLTFLAVAQATYAVFTVLVPDWSTIWLGTVLHAGLAAMYGIGWVLARFTAPEAPMLFELQDVRLQMPFWCFVMGMSALGLSLLFGRFAYTWRRDFELDLKRAALERRQRSLGGAPAGFAG